MSDKGKAGKGKDTASKDSGNKDTANKESQNKDSQNKEIINKNKATASTGVGSSSASSEQAAKAPPETGGAPAPETDAGKTAIDAQRQIAATSAPKKDGAASAKTQTTANKAPSSPGTRRVVDWLFMLLIVGALFAGASYLLQQTLQERDRQAQERNSALQDQLAESQERLTAVKNQQAQLAQVQAEQQQKLVARVNDLEQTLAHQRDRLRALSTTTREDWLLAEAEYLLKLANQRLLIERNTRATQALMEEADRILRDLDDPDLLPVRRALAQDLTQIKLATQVDLEGLYLRLASLAETIHQLPTMPRRQVAEPAGENQNESQTAEPQTWWRDLLSDVKDAFSGLGNFIRVRDHAERPRPILPPDSAEYLQQNLRLMLERAQLAAMREQADIYQRSLTNLKEWTRRYYPQTEALDNFLAQVTELANVEVQQDLPDISESLERLSDYINRLHKLDRIDGSPATADDQPEAQQ